MRRSLALGLLAALAIGVGWLACRLPAAAAAEPERVELRVYDVPKGYENEAQRMLGNALLSGDKPIGRVDVGPGGKLVVVAPRPIHDGVQRFMEDLRSLDTPLPSPQSVSLTYWLVVGRPRRGGGPGEVALRGGDSGEVAPALQQIVASQGPTEFSLLERARLSSTDNREWARTRGSHATIAQRTTTAEGKVMAELNIEVSGGNSVTTQVILEPGQFLVLGQTGYAVWRNDAAFDSPSPRDPVTLYYVVVAIVDR